MGHDAVCLPETSGRAFGGEEDGEEQRLQRRKSGVDLRQGPRQMVQRQVGENREGEDMADGLGHAWKGEILVLDQMVFRQAGRIGKLCLMAAQHQGARFIGGPVMAGVQIRHRFTAQPQTARADIQKVVIGAQARLHQDLHLRTARLVPAPADDIAVLAPRQCDIVKPRLVIGRDRAIRFGQNARPGLWRKFRPAHRLMP